MGRVDIVAVGEAGSEASIMPCLIGSSPFGCEMASNGDRAAIAMKRFVTVISIGFDGIEEGQYVFEGP